MCSRKCDQVLHFLVRRLPVWQSSWVLGQGAHMRVEGFQKGERRKSLGHSCWHVKQPESQKENILEMLHLFSSLSAASRWEIVRKLGLIWLREEVTLFSSVQSLSRVQLFATPWSVARQASLSITSSRSPPKPMSIVSVMHGLLSSLTLPWL